MTKPFKKGKKVAASGTSASKSKKQETSKKAIKKNRKQSTVKKKLPSTSRTQASSAKHTSRRPTAKPREASDTESYDSQHPTASPKVAEPGQLCEKADGKRLKANPIAGEQDSFMQVTDHISDLVNAGDLAPTPVLSPSSQNPTLYFRFSDTELTEFLSDVESFLCRLCCRTTAHITLQVPNSAAFLSTDERGRLIDSTMLSSTIVGKAHEGAPGRATENSYDWKTLLMDGSRAHEEVYRTVRSTIAASCALSHRSCQALWGPCGSGKHRIVRLIAEECSRQANTFVIQLHGRLLRSDEAAIRVIAQQMLVFLKSPQSEAVRRADWSIRTGTFDFGQLFHFERELATELTTQTHQGEADPMPGEVPIYDGGELLNEGDALLARESGRRDKKRGSVPAAFRQPLGPGGSSLSAAAQGATKRTKITANKQNPRRDSLSVAGANIRSDILNEEEEKEEEEDDVYPFITTTTTYLSGGAASALPHLQRALLLLKHHGTNLVVCVRHADQFSVWCDRLLYVLSGLMHESDGQGGGMSLLLTSSASDVRQMEKRLSSRLTCVVCYVPLLPWTPATLLRAVFSILLDWSVWKLESVGFQQDQEAHRSRTQDQPADVNDTNQKILNRRARVGKGRSGGRNSKRSGSLKEADDALAQLAGRAADLYRRKTTLSHLLPFPLDELPLPASPATPGDGVRCNPTDSGPALIGESTMRASKEEASAPERPSLYAHPTLAFEAFAFICRQQLQRLDALGAGADSGGGCSSPATHPSSGGTDSTDFSLVSNVIRLTEDIFAAGCTPQASLAALVQCLTKCSSGALDLRSSEDHAEELAWLRQRQIHEKTWPWMEAANHSQAEARGMDNFQRHIQPNNSATFTLLRGRAPLSLRFGPRASVTRSTASASSVLDPALLPPNLWGLLDEGHLVRLGYFSRESVLILFYLLMHQEAGIDRRSIADLLEDVSSSLGVKAAAALDRAAYRASIEQLTRWRMLKMREMGESVSLSIGASRLREALKVIFARQADWCEDLLGLDPKDYMKMRSLIG